MVFDLSLVDILVANLCCNYMHVHVTFVHMCARVADEVVALPCESEFLHPSLSGRIQLIKSILDHYTVISLLLQLLTY